MRILSFTFVLCLLAAISQAQPDEPKKYVPKRTDHFIRMKGIRAGFNLTQPFQDLWTKGNRYGSELSLDMELWPNWFPVFETGYEVMKIETDHINFSGKGNYSRIGFDYNILEAESMNDKDIFFIGLRYGFALANQKVSQYALDSYWGQETGNFGQQNIFAHWGEVVLGLKGEILHNLYLGWSIRGKVKMNHTDLDLPPVYFIPGYGKTKNGVNLDFTYSISYNLPWDFRKSLEDVKSGTRKIN